MVTASLTTTIWQTGQAACLNGKSRMLSFSCGAESLRKHERTSVSQKKAPSTHTDRQFKLGAEADCRKQKQSGFTESQRSPAVGRVLVDRGDVLRPREHRDVGI